MNHHRPKKHETRGEMISTFAFSVSGLFFVGEAHLYFTEGAMGPAVMIGLCAVLCLAGALRFHLHNLWGWFGQRRK